MHNLHLIVINAEDLKDACKIAESVLLDWGTENNWRSFIGAIDQEGNTYFTGEGREFINKEVTLEYLTQMVKGWVSKSFWGTDGGKLLRSIANGRRKLTSLESHHWWSIMKYAEFKGQSTDLDLKHLDIFKDEFYSGHFDECGITNFAKDEEKKYIVFIDMHS